MDISQLGGTPSSINENRPVPQRKQRTIKTTAITLRLKKDWVRRIEQLAFRLSEQHKVHFSPQTLITEAVRRFFIRDDYPVVAKRLHLTNERDRLRDCKRALREDDVSNSHATSFERDT